METTHLRTVVTVAKLVAIVPGAHAWNIAEAGASDFAGESLLLYKRRGQIVGQFECSGLQSGVMPSIAISGAKDLLQSMSEDSSLRKCGCSE